LDIEVKNYWGRGIAECICKCIVVIELGRENCIVVRINKFVRLKGEII
jgi:hypothetical protein